MMKVIKKIYMFFVVVLSLLLGISYQIFANRLELLPATSNTGKYFCSYPMNVRVKYQTNPYLTCSYNILYTGSDETLTGWCDESYWTSNHSIETGNNGNIYYLHGEQSKGKPMISSDIGCSTIYLVGENTGKSSTTLLFADRNQVVPVSIDRSETDNQLSVCGDDNGSTINTLTSFAGLTVPYEACPCDLDGTAPSVGRTSHKFTMLEGRYTGLQTMKFLVYDYNKNKEWKYWYSGFSNTDLTKYQGVPSNLFVDNQEGVNSGTIKVKIEYLDPAYGEMSGQSDKFGKDGSSFKNIYEYTGTLKNSTRQISEKTWDSNYRGYWVEVENTTGFLVEKLAKVTIEASDNELDREGDTVCKRTTLKNMVWSGYINQATKPTIKWLNISSGDASVNPNLTVSMKISDDWAGIDTESLVVDVIYPECTGTVEDDSFVCTTVTDTYSSGNFFTGDMFELSGGAEGLGNAGGYVVTFALTDLPTETGIILSGYVKDLAGNSTGSQITFYTRKPCSDFGCRDSFTITGVYEREGFGKPSSFGILPLIIVVEGSDYVELTGEYNDLLMCGPEVVPAYLTGNIAIFNENGETGAVNITDLRDGNIYFSGLDVEYDADNNYVNVID